MKMNKQITNLRIRIKQRRLWLFCKRHFNKNLGEEHGPAHWKRVALFGEMLCMMDPAADNTVINAFACIHDVERKNNLDDPGHGTRAAELAEKLRGNLLNYLDGHQMEMLKTACIVHTHLQRTDSPTVNACLDADRMDLPRYGTRPDPQRMASEKGAETVSGEDFRERVWEKLRRDAANPVATKKTILDRLEDTVRFHN